MVEREPASDRGPVTVLVADDHPMWRDAVAGDLADAGFVVVGTAADGPSAVTRTLAGKPDVLVLDLNLPGLRGHEVCAKLTEAKLSTRVLILSVSGEQRDVLDAIKAGASGYLVKSASREEFLEAVRRTAQGRTVFTPGVAGLVLGEYRRLQNGPGPRRTASGSPADRARDRNPAPRRHRAGLQGHRLSAVHLAPHGAEPRAEHAEQAADAQPGRAGPLRDRPRPGLVGPDFGPGPHRSAATAAS